MNKENKFEIKKDIEKGIFIYLLSINKDEYESISNDMDGLKTQADVNRFTEKYKIQAKDIMLYGESNLSKLNKEDKEFIHLELEKIFPPSKSILNPISKKVENSYKCYCCEGLNVDDLTEHKTVNSAWNCLMTKLRKPEYVLIYKEKIK